MKKTNIIVTAIKGLGLNERPERLYCNKRDNGS